MQEALSRVEGRLSDLIERHAAQTTKLGTQTATLLATQKALQAERNENARLAQAALDSAARLDDKDNQIQTLKDQHLHAHTQCALLQERLQNALSDSEKIQARLTERDQQNRVLELILIKTEVALENLRAGHPDTQDLPKR
jgi:chromosome segregation ATPase